MLKSVVPAQDSSVREARKHVSVTASCALVCAAIAFWLSFGALAFLDTSNRASYVAILPSPVWLVALLAVVALVIYLARPAARDAAPLWLSTVLLLPWLPIRLPLAVFIWTGRVTTWVWIPVA